MSFKSSLEIEKLWRLRFLQKKQEVQRGLSQLSAEPNLDLSLRIEIEILQSSLMRAQGGLQESNQILKALSDRTSDLPFQFFVQRGLNLFVEGEFSLALEFLTRAQRMAHSLFEQLIASSNVLLCLENLNLETGAKFSEVKKYLRLLQDREMSEAMEQHLQAFEQRQAFRSGKIPPIFKNDAKGATQAFYQRLWVASLPFVFSSRQGQNPPLLPLVLDQNWHMKNYRLRTLTGDTRFADGESVELREYVDRLYLWTWKWLAQPDEHHRENLKECLGKFRFDSFHKKLTGEDILMLQNSLDWILLFQPFSAKQTQPLRDLLSSQKIQWTPLFEIEALIIHYLMALQKKEPSKKKALAEKIKKHPLFKAPGLRWEKWLVAFSKEILAHQRPASGRFSVDPVSFKIKTKDLEFVSEPIVKLLQALYSQESLPFAEALEIAFGLSGYQEDFHKMKIYNLLSRVRPCLPKSLKIYSRQERIYLEGDRKTLCFLAESTRQIPLIKGNLIAPLLLEHKKDHRDRWVHPRLILKKALGRGHVSRHELQQMAQASKATTNRWIQKWLECGFIKKVGQGKSTSYLIELI